MEHATCCIGLCIFNSERGLPAVFRNLKALSARFQDTRILFYYDHSRDNTLQMVQEFCAVPEHRAEVIVNRMVVSTTRTQNIANARNGVLDEIRREYSGCDYFIMMDANEYSCVGEMDLDTLNEVFLPGKVEQWDAVSFDREAGYYDFWALSFGEFVYSVWHFDPTQVMSKRMRDVFNPLLSQYKTERPDEFIPVLSAFNGCAVYKTSRFAGCSYSATIDMSLFPPGSVQAQMERSGCRVYDHFGNPATHPQFHNDGDCEHRRFHLEAIQKNECRIRIYPKSVFRKVKGVVEGRGPA